MMLLQAEPNSYGRDFVVGDIHGYYQLLIRELERVDFDRKHDRLFAVGDLIDRGPDSLACISLLGEDWFYAVRGNHEQMMINALSRDDEVLYQLWLFNGGGWSSEWDRATLKALAERLDELLPLAIEVDTPWGRLGIVHAEPGSEWGADNFADTQRLLWSREGVWQEKTTSCRNIDLVVVGHTPVERPVLLGNVLHIDTGAFCTGKLTLMPLESVFQLRSLSSEK